MGWKNVSVVVATIFALLILLVASHGDSDGTLSAGQWHDPDYVHDADHIQEHYEGKAEVNTSAMTSEELEFHYFTQHDTDNNFKLDGLEILAAITEPGRHNHHGDGEKEDSVPLTIEEKKKKGEEVAENLKMMTEIVDKIFADDDADDDGYLTYTEYLAARRKAS